MKHDILAPSVGESITEVSILKWAKASGDFVSSGEKVLEVESDKATVEIVAEFAGTLTILKPEKERLRVGEVIGVIDDEAKAKAVPQPVKPQPMVGAPAVVPAVGPSASPSVRRAAKEQGLSDAELGKIQGSGRGGRLTKDDVLSHASRLPPGQQISQQPAQQAQPRGAPSRPGEKRVPMSALRRRIAERLVAAQHTAAILTTFNEADMSSVIEFRTANKEAFKAKHGVPLSYMSFFTKASVEALKIIPEVNASIEDGEIVYREYYDIGIAVGTERGLVVPVVRTVEKMTLVEIERQLAALATKAREGKLSIAEMSGGTFTISNGGIYGSLLSTPILNPPQSGILGMHKIQERPVAINGKIEIRPMMYLALSYDHRLIDGKGAVTFLVTVKDFIEHPEKLGLEF